MVLLLEDDEYQHLVLSKKIIGYVCENWDQLYEAVKGENVLHSSAF
jgi:hypothetical protein